MVKYGENEISGRAIVDKGEDLNADGTQHKASNGAVYHIADINVAIPNKDLPDKTRWSGPMDMVDMLSENKHEVFKGRIPAKTTSYTKKDGSIGYTTEYPAINDRTAFIRCTDASQHTVQTIENVLVLPSNNNGLDEKGNIKVAFIPTKKGTDHTAEGGRDNSADTFPISANGGLNEDASMKDIKTFSSIYLDSLEKNKRYFVGFPPQKMIKATDSYEYVTLDVKTSDPKNPDNMISKSVNFSLNKVKTIDEKGIHTQSAIVSDFTDGDRKTAMVSGYVDGKKDQKEQFRYEDVFNAYYDKMNELKKQKEANVEAARQGRIDDLRAKSSNKRVIDTPASAAPTAPAATEKVNELESPI
jgi:hypothetical protein